MSKRKLFLGILIVVIWSIFFMRLILFDSLYVFIENVKIFATSLRDFKFNFSISHFLDILALSAFLFITYYWVNQLEEKEKEKEKDKLIEEKEKLNIFKRIWNTLLDHDSILVKLLLIIIPIGVILFSILAFLDAAQIPEIFIILIVFTIVCVFKVCEKKHNIDIADKSYVFTNEPILYYSQLNDFQKEEVKYLKVLIDSCGKEYISIALNGNWGSGKTSILNGLKDFLEKKDLESKIDKSKYEVIELNLWQTRTPESAINELERLFKELFCKAYLNVSGHDLAVFSLLAEPINVGLSSRINDLFTSNESIPTSRKRLEEKLEKVLYRLKKDKLIILIDDLDRTPDQYLKGFLNIICYVTGLKNVVTISGINREKILSQLQKADNITVWADGINVAEKIAKEKNLNDNWNQTDVIKRDPDFKLEPAIKKEFHFPQFENESFLSKIFSVQKDLVQSEYDIKNFVTTQKDKIDRFSGQVKFTDIEEIKKSINDFVVTNLHCFNTYRDAKLFLNEVFIYLIGFGGKDQDKIKVSDYLEIDSILAMAWAKVVYPDFYKKVQDYVTPFIYREQSIVNAEVWKSSFELETFIKGLYSFSDEGKDMIINRIAHRQIKLIFETIEGEACIKNGDAAIRYFRPNIEPYEFTTIEYFNLFNNENVSVSNIKDFITTKWETNPRLVLADFIKRLKLRHFKLSERLNSALALMDFLQSFFDLSGVKKTEKNKEEFWGQIVSLLENESLIKKRGKYEEIKNIFNEGGFFNEIFELLVKLHSFKIEDSTTRKLWHISAQRNLFYKILNVSDHLDDRDKEIIENFKFLVNKIKDHEFENEENGIACLVYVYKLTYNNWRGIGKINVDEELVDALEPLFLDGFFSIFHGNTMFPKDLMNGFNAVFHSVRLGHDKILFNSENLDKLIFLFECGSLSFSTFMDRLRERKDICKLSQKQKSMAKSKLITFINNNTDYYKQSYYYKDVLTRFFAINSKN